MYAGINFVFRLSLLENEIGKVLCCVWEVILRNWITQSKAYEVHARVLGSACNVCGLRMAPVHAVSITAFEIRYLKWNVYVAWTPDWRVRTMNALSLACPPCLALQMRGRYSRDTSPLCRRLFVLWIRTAIITRSCKLLWTTPRGIYSVYSVIWSRQ